MSNWGEQECSPESSPNLHVKILTCAACTCDHMWAHLSSLHTWAHLSSIAKICNPAALLPLSPPPPQSCKYLTKYKLLYRVSEVRTCIEIEKNSEHKKKCGGHLINAYIDGKLLIWPNQFQITLFFVLYKFGPSWHNSIKWPEKLFNFFNYIMNMYNMHDMLQNFLSSAKPHTK